MYGGSIKGSCDIMPGIQGPSSRCRLSPITIAADINPDSRRRLVINSKPYLLFSRIQYTPIIAPTRVFSPSSYRKGSRRVVADSGDSIVISVKSEGASDLAGCPFVADHIGQGTIVAVIAAVCCGQA